MRVETLFILNLDTSTDLNAESRTTARGLFHKYKDRCDTVIWYSHQEVEVKRHKNTTSGWSKQRNQSDHRKIGVYCIFHAVHGTGMSVNQDTAVAAIKKAVSKERSLSLSNVDYIVLVACSIVATYNKTIKPLKNFHEVEGLDPKYHRFLAAFLPALLKTGIKPVVTGWDVTVQTPNFHRLPQVTEGQNGIINTATVVSD